MPRDREKLYATGRGGVTPPEWDQAMDLVSTGAVRDFLEDLLAYLDVGLPVSPLANDWMREQADRAAQLAERGIEDRACRNCPRTHRRTRCSREINSKGVAT